MNADSELLLFEQYKDLKNEYSTFDLRKKEDGLYRVTGLVPINAKYKDKLIDESYKIEMTIPDDYPKKHPKVRELAARISKSYEHWLDKDYLCLGATINVRMIFMENPTLLHFVDNIIRSYLFNYLVWANGGKPPSGERSHSGHGVYETYREIFKVRSVSVILTLLKHCIEGSTDVDLPCPCGSKIPLRFCHNLIINQIRQIYSKNEFIHDYEYIGTFGMKHKVL